MNRFIRMMSLTCMLAIAVTALFLTGCSSSNKKAGPSAVHSHVVEPGGRPFLIKTDNDFLIDGVPSPLIVELELYVSHNSKFNTDYDVYGQLARSLLKRRLEDKLPTRLEHDKSGMPILRRDKVLELLWDEKEYIANKISPPLGEQVRFVVITIRGS